MAAATFALAASLLTRTASVDCVTSRGKPTFTTCRVAHGETLRLFYADAQGVRYETFEGLQKSLARQQRRLVFAMNAGMFHPDMKPVGLLVIDGHEIAAINRATGSGNFYLQPNGVFLIDKKGSRVLATDEYRESTPAFATQSGPMLLHHGQIPDTAAFRESSNSRRIRNEVCGPTRARHWVR